MNHDDVNRMLERLEARLTAALQAIVDFVPISVSSDSGAKDFVKVQGDPKDRQRAARRVSPWGISGRPVPGVLGAVVKALGGYLGGMIVGIATDQYGPQDLKPGETCIWNKVNGTRIVLDENGKMTIDAAPGQDVVVNGGTLRVARKTDPVKVTIPSNTVIVAVAGGTLNASPIVLDGTIQDGAERFKG